MLINNYRGVYLVWHFVGKYNAVFTHNHAMKKCRKQRTHGDKVCAEIAAKNIPTFVPIKSANIFEKYYGEPFTGSPLFVMCTNKPTLHCI